MYTCTVPGCTVQLYSNLRETKERKMCVAIQLPTVKDSELVYKLGVRTMYASPGKRTLLCFRMWIKAHSPFRRWAACDL